MSTSFYHALIIELDIIDNVQVIAECERVGPPGGGRGEISTNVMPDKHRVPR